MGIQYGLMHVQARAGQSAVGCGQFSAVAGYSGIKKGQFIHIATHMRHGIGNQHNVLWPLCFYSELSTLRVDVMMIDYQATIGFAI